MKRLFLFLTVLLISHSSVAEKIAVRDGYNGPVIGYDNKEFIMSVNNSEEIEYLNDQWLRFGGPRLLQEEITENFNIANCDRVGEIDPEEIYNFFAYLEKGKENKWDMFIQYPDTYECTISKESANLLLTKAVQNASNEIAYINSDEAKESARKYKEYESKIGVCDGKQMYGYVSSSIEMGRAVLRVANDKRWGARATNLALTSDPMHYYLSLRSDIRTHDLYLVRSGCTSLSDGPTESMLSELKDIERKISKLATRDYTDSGLVTGAYGELK